MVSANVLKEWQISCKEGGREKVKREHKHEDCGRVLKHCFRQSDVGHWVEKYCG